MMKKYLITGGIFALLSVLLGAIGSHALENRLSTESLQAFETANRYLMYHALALLVISQTPLVTRPWIFRLFFWGVLLFCFSIYALSLGSLTPFQWSVLGPVTPMGGGLLILGWALLIMESLKLKSK
jgi:uncharacterized membrane protein YgdD (TMEM256/DUF423 family)